MTYFRDFPRVLYTFGNEETADAFENIALYADTIDQVRDAVGLYEDYYIQNGERPDQVSFKLYESTKTQTTCKQIATTQPIIAVLRFDIRRTLGPTASAAKAMPINSADTI